MGNSETCSLLDDGAGLLKCVCSLLIAVVGCPVLGGGGGGVLAFLTYPWGPAVSRTCPTVINAASFRNALMVGDRFASTYSIGNSEFY